MVKQGHESKIEILQTDEDGCRGGVQARRTCYILIGFPMDFMRACSLTHSNGNSAMTTSSNSADCKYRLAAFSVMDFITRFFHSLRVLLCTYPSIAASLYPSA